MVLTDNTRIGPCTGIIWKKGLLALPNLLFSKNGDGNILGRLFAKKIDSWLDRDFA
jgi:hypothetical protein